MVTIRHVVLIGNILDRFKVIILAFVHVIFFEKNEKNKHQTIINLFGRINIDHRNGKIWFQTNERLFVKSEDNVRFKLVSVNWEKIKLNLNSVFGLLSKMRIGFILSGETTS